MLPEESRKIVDECLDRILPEDWQQCRSIIESVAESARVAVRQTETASEAGRDEVTRFMTGAIIAAVLDKLESPEIVEAEQAQLFAMSASIEHQAAACDWFIEQCGRPTFDTDIPELAFVPGITLH